MALVEKLTHILALWHSGVWFDCQHYVMTLCNVLYFISDDTLVITGNFYFMHGYPGKGI